MARKAARKETNAERQAKLKEKFVQPEVVELPPTEEGIELMKRAIEEGKSAKFRDEAQPTDEQVQVAEKEAMKELDEALPELDEENEVEFVADDEAEEQIKSGGVVKDVFKKRYIDNAIASGATHKAAKRSNWDWLAQEIAKFCLDDKGKIDIRAFVSLLNVNEVDHSRWTNRNRGWEGRFRMTGRVALQKIVATQGFLRFPDDLSVEAPAEWRNKFLPKA